MPTIKSPSPTPQQLNVLAHSLARRITQQPADVDDLVQEALFSYHRSSVHKKSFALARTLLQRCMWIYWSGGWRYSGARHREDFPLTAAPPDKMLQDPQGAWNNALDLDAYLNALEVMEGMLARRVAENLLQPQDERYCKLLRITARRKARLKQRGSKHIRPSHVQLRTAFKLTRTEWHRTLHRIRQFTADYLAERMSDPATLPVNVLRYRKA